VELVSDGNNLCYVMGVRVACSYLEIVPVHSTSLWVSVFLRWLWCGDVFTCEKCVRCILRLCLRVRECDGYWRYEDTFPRLE
jgi:hypothetical protein